MLPADRSTAKAPDNGIGTQQAILTPGSNCWRLCDADRVTFLVDGEAYFSAFRHVVSQAKHTIMIVGWDIDSRVQLVRDDQQHRLPVSLGKFLNAVVSRPRGPRAYVLAWDFAMIYALEREWLPLYKFGLRTHRHLHFQLDGRHPPGASHHQKIVVVDDSIAFVGGLDLTRARWDTPEHRADDPRRVDHNHAQYGPFHDVQMMVEGDVAAALGDLARWRWERSTGRELTAPPSGRRGLWPTGLAPDLTEVQVGIARTQPEYHAWPEVREVERLYLDSIASARNSIYCENQYLTSNAIGEALERRLREEQGPEVILVLPQKTSGWLEQTTMDVLRARWLDKLQKADNHGRLRVYCPSVPGNGCINVHAKVMIVDDELLRIGSSNLSNRSMGLDTECDLVIASSGQRSVSAEIAAFRNRLLAEHLGSAPAKIAQLMDETRSLLATVEALRDGERTLVEVDGRVPELLNEELPDAGLIDPDHPLDPEYLANKVVPTEAQERASGRGVRFGLTLLALLALAAAWRWTPLHDWANVQTVRSWLEALDSSPATPFAVLGLFIGGGLVAVPVTLLIVVTAAIYGPALGFAYSLVGSFLSAVITYAIGYYIGRGVVSRLASSKVGKLNQALARRGIITIIALRVLPVAPFTLINMVAGASQIRFRDYALGTLIGMAPGMLALSIFIEGLKSAVFNPGVASFAIVAAAGVAVVAIVILFRRWVLRRGATGRPQRRRDQY